MQNCSNCSERFDALEWISETPINTDAYSPILNETLPWEIKRESISSLTWNLALTAGLILLLFQIFHFEGANFVQNKNFRPWLEKTCTKLNCTLPVYRNLNELTVIHSKFSPLTEKSHQLLAVFVNQAVLPQPYPDIRMILMEFSGRPFAQRIFHPADYLPQHTDHGHMAAGEQITIDLHISKSEIPVGGYTIDLI